MSSRNGIYSVGLAGEEQEISTLPELLRWRALHQTNRPAYTFLVDGEKEEENITYGELDRRARAVGALLQRRELSGKRALLLYPPGLDYVIAFYACLYAGVVAVPAYPARLNRNPARLQSILEDAQAAAILSPEATLSRLEHLARTPELQKFAWLATDTVRAEAADELREPTLTGDRLAYLQYTSGSTSAPKGVMVSHANIVYNSAYIDEGFEHTAESVSLTWLPHFHDMGLIYGILQPLYKGFHGFIMSPASFVQRPARWLEAITRYKITHSGGPNFAYDLCVRKLAPAERAALDLRSWRVAFNGAEPIRQETLDQFNEAFAPQGFRRDAFYAAYGLAEATLKVSGGRGAQGPPSRRVSASALEQNRVVAAGADDNDAHVLVSCGQVGSGTKVMIVNPDSSSPCAAGEVGEVWVSGPGVAQGYWNRPEETKRTFQAYTEGAGAEGPFLRTGDLGFRSDGELYVTGRLKDMIIIRGLNHYPQDIELTVGRSHPQLGASGGAAFSVEVRGEERLVVVQEIRPRAGMNLTEVTEAIRRSVAEAHELQIYAVVLVKPGGVPKTSSGKVQRRACRKSFLEGSLAELERSLLPESNPAAESNAVSGATLLSLAPGERSALLPEYLRGQVARVLNLDPRADGWQASLPALGLDSLTAIELKNLIEVDLKIVVPLVDFLRGENVEQLAHRIDEQLSAAQPTPLDSLTPTPAGPGSYPLSYGQKSLWFIYLLAPESAAYNIARAMRLDEELDVPAFRDAFQALVDRHPSLRTTFNAADGEPLQQVHASMQVCFEVEDVSARDESFLEGRLTEEAHRPFDLERGPLLRVKLFTQSPREHVLLIAVHHIIGDFWSLGLLMRELATFYAAARDGSAPGLNSPGVQYADYTLWQTRMLAGANGERLWSYWREQLAGELPVLNLPTDHVRPSVQTYTGGARSIRLGASLTRRVKSLSAERNASLYTVLLAAFQVLLHRYTGQEDILTGSPTSGRSRAELAGVVGYFANPVVLRANLTGNPTFAEFLARVRQTTLAALDHQDFPFALLVERLQVERNPSRSPIFQVMFVLQQTQVRDEAGLTLFALGEAGGRVNLNGLVLESVALEQRVAQFDLTLMMAEVDEELTASIEYNTDLFDAATITRMLGHFQTLLEGIVADPQRRISDLPLLDAPERQQLLGEWNRTGVAYPQDLCIHQLFEAQAARTPHASAVVGDDEELTYDELNRRANRLAHRLRRSGVGPEVPVALCMERSALMMVGLLGILKAGGAYVPLDPAYPRERLAFMLEDAGVRVVVTQTSLLSGLSWHGAELILPDTFASGREAAGGVDGDDEADNPSSGVAPDNLAYVIYTSGSLGRPKGVMVAHRHVLNFFTGMDHALGSQGPGVWLALTSISFDISVLELFWTLARGFRVVIHGEEHAARLPEAHAGRAAKPLELSLAYFASDAGDNPSDKYRLLIEGAKFADRHGFAAIWTPERHFHAFGGLYPNPSVISAAIAAITERIGIRAGSVVLPLHSPIRVAEEWSVVDNLSGGRVGVSFASGWHPRDFVIAPASYAERKELMREQIEVVCELWRGGSAEFEDGVGKPATVRILPRPVQPELPVWITAAGSPDTFRLAGELGVNLLTHLLGQNLEELSRKIEIYRQAWREAGHARGEGHVTLMLHTFVGEDLESVRETVRVPFSNYLGSSMDLLNNSPWGFPAFAAATNSTAGTGNAGGNGRPRYEDLGEADRQAVLAYAFDRYFETSGLFGTPSGCRKIIERMRAVGVDEIACLIDFGVDFDGVLSSLRHLATLVEPAGKSAQDAARDSFAARLAKHRVTHLQCTPSRARLLASDEESLRSLGSLKKLLLGGEALPASLARQLGEVVTGEMHNMYGPTETTIWSTTQPVAGDGGAITIGRPIANTEVFILDRHLQPLPVGVPGELLIGGEGVVRGYVGRPEATAERFIPHPFARQPGARLYRTGDLARYLPNGEIEYLGRLDHQIKLRGFRIELGEIEAALRRNPNVADAVVVAREDEADDHRLVAYVVGATGSDFTGDELRGYLKETLPEYMIPSAFVPLGELPLTPNGKVDRRALPAPEQTERRMDETYIAPRTPVEETLAQIWADVLKVERVGIYDNFFSAGGHSLLMTQVVSRIRDTFRVELPMQSFFQEPMVADLAIKITQMRAAQKGDDELSRLLEELESQ